RLAGSLDYGLRFREASCQLAKLFRRPFKWHLQRDTHAAEVKDNRLGSCFKHSAAGQFERYFAERISQRCQTIRNRTGRPPPPCQVLRLRRQEPSRMFEIDFVPPIKRHKHMQPAAECGLIEGHAADYSEIRSASEPSLRGGAMMQILVVGNRGN